MIFSKKVVDFKFLKIAFSASILANIQVCKSFKKIGIVAFAQAFGPHNYNNLHTDRHSF